MAFPVIDASAETAVATAGTSHAITLPAGSGGLLLCILAKGVATAGINAHADWSELLDEPAATTNGLYIAYSTTAAGSTSTLVSDAATRSATIVHRISNASPPHLQAPQIGTTASGASVSPDPPAVTPTGGAKDYLWIACFSRSGEEADDDTWTTAAPTGFDGLLQKACGIAGSNLGGMIAVAKDEVNASTLNPGVFTCATGTWRAQTIAVHPAPAPVPLPILAMPPYQAHSQRSRRW
jgi:hypothetical protein